MPSRVLKTARMARSLSTGQASCQIAQKHFTKLLWSSTSTSTVLTVQRCSILHAAAHKGISTCLHRFQQKPYMLQTPPSASVLAHSTCNSRIVTPCAAGPSLLLACQVIDQRLPADLGGIIHVHSCGSRKSPRVQVAHCIISEAGRAAAAGNGRSSAGRSYPERHP